MDARSIVDKACRRAAWTAAPAVVWCCGALAANAACGQEPEATAGDEPRPVRVEDADAPTPRSKLDPLLARRVADLAAGGGGAAAGTERPARETGAGAGKRFVAVTIYFDARERIPGVETFLTEKGGRPGTAYPGGAGDVFGGALTAVVPVSLLLDLAARPGVDFIRERVRPKAPRGPPGRRGPPSARTPPAPGRNQAR